MKKVNCYGVLITSMQEMQFSKLIRNEGIAMNTLTSEARKILVEDWLSKDFSGLCILELSQ